MASVVHTIDTRDNRYIIVTVERCPLLDNTQYFDWGFPISSPINPRKQSKRKKNDSALPASMTVS